MGRPSLSTSGPCPCQLAVFYLPSFIRLHELMEETSAADIRARAGRVDDGTLPILRIDRKRDLHEGSCSAVLVDEGLPASGEFGLLRERCSDLVISGDADSGTYLPARPARLASLPEAEVQAELDVSLAGIVPFAAIGNRGAVRNDDALSIQLARDVDHGAQYLHIFAVDVIRIGIRARHRHSGA